MDIKKIEESFKNIISAIKEDETRVGLIDSPKRIALSYQEIFSGLSLDPQAVVGDLFPVETNDTVIEKNINFYSMCEHHFLPFFGTIDIAYIPNYNVLGFGDLIKIVEVLSKRPQIQERLTSEIARNISKIVDSKDVMVVIKAKHLCMTMRGQKKENAEIITTAVSGVFENDVNRRIEILTMLK